jgi:KDO2-lipid IV(A) lauroyltransferase
MHIIARPIANPWLQAFIKRLRSPTGQHIHPRRGGIRHLLAALRAGYAVGTLPDQNQRLRGIFVPVFGRLASCDRSQARLAQLAGCPILVGAAVRSGRGFRFRIAVSDVFTVPAADGPESDPIWDGTHRLQQAVEKLILEAPEQYFWVHNRYRTRPPAEKAAADGEVAQASAS